MDTLKLLLAGDVMTGRGIDQIMPAPLPPDLYEPFVRDARLYVRLAERVNGPIPAPVSLDYIWGDALAEMQALAPDARVVNLETAVTRSQAPDPAKGIHYRMNPAHAGCLAVAKIDACSLANNHVLDWGVQGLRETLATLAETGVRCAGAGCDLCQAAAPALLPMAGGAQVLMLARATASSGVSPKWAARDDRPGVALLPDLSDDAVGELAEQVRPLRRSGDLVVASLHWGANWVERLPAQHRAFAHRLIELGAADVVHGHSSHHPLPIEVHAGKLILYGCGDLINDYEGIAPQHAPLRSDMGCLYAATLRRDDGMLVALEIVPLQLRQLRLMQARPRERRELREWLDSSCRPLGTRLEDGPRGHWRLGWD